MKKYNKKLYYRKKVDGVKYSKNPPGTFDVGRALAGRDCWQSPNLVEGDQPKVIAITDVTLIGASQEMANRFKDHIADLLDQGFEIYIARTGYYKQISHDSLHDVSDKFIRGLMGSFPSPETAKKVAVEQLHLSDDKIFMLDDYKILMTPEELQLDIKQINLNLESIDKLAQVESALNIRVLNKLETYLPFIVKRTEQINKLTVNCANLDKKEIEEIVESLSKIPKLAFTGMDNQFCEFVFNMQGSLTDVEEVTFYGGISARQLLMILSKMPNLKTLCILDCNNLKNISPDESEALARIPIDLSGLNKLELLSSQLSPQLQSILAGAMQNEVRGCQLKSYNQQGCDIDLISVFNGDLPLLDVTWHGTPTQTIISALSKIKNVESLDIGGQMRPQEIIKAAGPIDSSLPPLEKFALAKSAIPELSQLKLITLTSSLCLAWQLATKVPKLETLVLQLMPPLAVKIPLDSLDHLKFVFLYADNAKEPTQQELEQILKASPNLESITISKTQPEPELLEAIMAVSKKYPNVIFSMNGECIRNEVLIYSVDAMSEKTKIDRVNKENRSRTPTDAETVFNLREHAEFKPTKDQFEFEGKAGFQQGAVIERLCQYLILKNSPAQEIIPKIQDGVCWSLSNLFSDIGSESLSQLISKVVAWNGKELPQSEVQLLLDQVLDYVQRFQLGAEKNHNYYLGDSFDELMKTESPPYVITNCWHAIAIRKEQDEWVCYDPNYANGVFRAKTEADLIAEIEKRIGKLLFIANKKCDLQPTIKNQDHFFENGGIFALFNASNCSDLLRCIDPKAKLSRSALDGLMLRNMNGAPAWFVGLSSQNAELREITIRQLKDYIKVNRQYSKVISHSLEALSGEDQNKGIDLFAEVLVANPIVEEKAAPLKSQKVEGSQPPVQKKDDVFDQHIKDIKSKAYFNQFKEYFTAKNKESEQVFTVDEYARSLVQGAKSNSKVLVGLTDGAHVHSLALSIERYCHATSKPVFYINSPDDLSMTAPIVKRQADNSGVIVDGPAGELYDYLERCKTNNEKAVLIVNYDRFTADDIVRFNGMIDINRKIDGIAIPPSVQIIGLTNTKSPDCYQGSDFYSRFDLVDQCGLHANRFQQAALVSEKTEGVDPCVIDLYLQDDWKSMLLGRWLLRGDQLVFAPGLIEQAKFENRSIEIKNGPWEDPDFTQFWHRAKMYGYVDVPGKRIPIPQDLKITRNDDIQQENWFGHIQLANGLLAGEIPVLNPVLLNQFYHQYRYDHQQLTLNTDDGIVKQHAGRVLSINLTRNIPDNEWARLIDECIKYKVTLEVHCASDISLSPRLEALRASLPASPALKLNQTFSILTNDIDISVENLKKAHPAEWVVIDISECRSADLLKAISAKLNGSRFEFTETENVLLSALKENKSIVLKGRFSKELSDALAPILLARNNSGVRGQLALVTDSNDAFDYMPIERSAISNDEKISYLRAKGFTDEQIATIEPAILANETSAKLVARLISMQTHPGQSGDSAWIGMRQISGQIKLPAFNVETSAAEAAQFIKGRLELIERGLSVSPFVFVSGITGVGKSTFIEKYIAKEGRRLYRNEENISAWANDSDDHEKILFIDEANIGDKHWSQFEGLFNHPPGILINGVYRQLTNKHKVIFAGNPLNYGDRVLPSLFERHGNAVLFEILPPSLIYEDILKPVLTHPNQHLTAEVILKAYQFMCEQSPNEILMTPRELQMIALMTQNYLDRTTDPKINAADIAAYYTYQVMNPLVKPSFANEFDKLFKPKSDLASLTVTVPPSGDYIMTESRKRLLSQLQDLLSLREWRQSKAKSPEQMYGGLGGIVIEGEPGIGKSELVIHALRAAGYHQPDEPIQNPGKIYYSMPVSMPYQQKIDLLLKAFHEGAVVIVDEINSSPMMERLLNDLLMGKTPDGERPNKPGFMLIGTQNPPTMAGRQVMSPALARRLITAELSAYKKDEMQFILGNKGLKEEMIEPLVDAYLAAHSDAIKNHITPIPCFRDVSRFANKIIERHKAELEVKQQKVSSPVIKAEKPIESTVLPKESETLAIKISDQEAKLPSNPAEKPIESAVTPEAKSETVPPVEPPVKTLPLEISSQAAGLFKPVISPVKQDEFSPQTKRPVLDPKRLEIIANLTKYVERIESYRDKSNDIKFDTFKFPFYKQSRGKNRMANYILAKYLIAQLQSTDSSISDVFKEAHQLRSDIIKSNVTLSAKDFKDRGINSGELKGIIERGKKIR